MDQSSSDASSRELVSISLECEICYEEVEVENLREGEFKCVHLERLDTADLRVVRISQRIVLGILHRCHCRSQN